MAASSLSSAWSSVLLSQSERDFILAGCRQDCRVDGRRCDEFRKFTIITGNEQTHDDQHGQSSVVMGQAVVQQQSQPQLALSAGSARLLTACGSTHLLCSVKAEVVRPTSSSPNEGVVELHVETLTTAASSGSGSSGMSRRDCDELAVLLSRLLFPQSSSSRKGSNDDDDSRHSLCILPHHYVWRLHVDLYLLASGGGCLLDAASHVIRAALQNTLLPLVTTTAPSDESEAAPGTGSTCRAGGEHDVADAAPNIELLVDGDIQKARPPAIDTSMIVSVAVLNCSRASDADDGKSIALLLDATAPEESCASAIVHIAVNHQKSDKKKQSNNNDKDKNDWVVTAIQKSLPGSLPLNLLPEIMATALKGAHAQTSRSTTLESMEQTTAAWEESSAKNTTTTTTTTTERRPAFSFLQEQFSLQ